MKTLPKRSRGFTLLELLVTIIIGAFITLAAVTFMHNTAVSYHTQDMTARLQENARFAVQMMSYDLRQAGYYGCSGDAPDDTFEVVDGTDGDGGDSDEVIISFAKATGGAVDVKGDPADGDDAFDIVQAGTSIDANAKDYFAAGQEVIVADCLKSEIATIKTSGVGGVNRVVLEEALVNDYNTTTTIRALSNARYFVDVGDDNVPSLYREQDGAAQPIVDGVDYMRVLYGVDTDENGQPDKYQAIGDLTGSEKVVSLRLGMLIRSISNKTRDEESAGEYGLESDDRTYGVLDQTITPEELRVTRRVFSTTMMLRNQS